MSESLQSVEAYLSFFETLAGASAAILALVLATFQLNIEKWRALPLREAVALVTLAELAVPLFFSVIFLIPTHPWRFAGIATGALGYAMVLWHLYKYVRNLREARSFDHWQMWLGGLVSGITFSIVLWSDSIESKAWVCVWFIFSGLSEAWIFLPRATKKSELKDEGKGAADCRSGT